MTLNYFLHCEAPGSNLTLAGDDPSSLVQNLTSKPVSPLGAQAPWPPSLMMLLQGTFSLCLCPCHPQNGPLHFLLLPQLGETFKL